MEPQARPDNIDCIGIVTVGKRRTDVWRMGMVRVVFIDGTDEYFEAVNNEFTYDQNTELFELERLKTGTVMFPREFVKYITAVEV